MRHADPECHRCHARLCGLSEPQLCDDCAFHVLHEEHVAFATRVAKSAITLRREKRDTAEARAATEMRAMLAKLGVAA